MDWTPEELQAIVDEHPLVLFMKGEPEQHSVASSSEQRKYVLGRTICVCKYSNRPCNTFRLRLVRLPNTPQVFVHGELIGDLTSLLRCGTMEVFEKCSTQEELDKTCFCGTYRFLLLFQDLSELITKSARLSLGPFSHGSNIMAPLSFWSLFTPPPLIFNTIQSSFFTFSSSIA